MEKSNIKSCILDLNIDCNTKKIKIIELNPWGRTTGSGFYDWEKDIKIQILYF